MYSEKNAARITADLIRKYQIGEKTTVTSFCYDALKEIRIYAPELRTGYLTGEIDDCLLNRMRADGIDELCPKATLINAESIQKWRNAGFGVRAWGIYNEDLMRQAYDIGVDGMTVNFPDKLHSYITRRTEEANNEV